MQMRILPYILLVFFASGTLAADSARIVAVVNDQIISTIDLENRISIILATTGIADSEATRAKITPQVIHQLIDDTLQLQEAEKNGIAISDKKIQEAITTIEHQSNKAPGSLLEYLRSRNASENSFYEQIRAQIAWSEIVLKKIRPKIRISDQEVALYTKRKEASPLKNAEVQITTIQLPVESPQKEQETAKLAEKLASEIHKGASFEAVASQFSTSASGRIVDPFWIELSSLDPAIGKVLAKQQKNTVSDPIRTEAGYQLIKLLDVREKAQEGGNAEITLKQIVVTPKPGVTKVPTEQVRSVVTELQNTLVDCNSKTVKTKKPSSKLDVKVAFNRVMRKDLPEPVAKIIDATKVGTNSTPITTANGIIIFTVCERIDIPEKSNTAANPLSNEAIKQAIFGEKIELEAQKYMRNLRADAFIDIRNF